MNDSTNTANAQHDRYFLREQERWESLGFDWRGWNSTVEKILRRQAAPASTQRRKAVADGASGQDLVSRKTPTGDGGNWLHPQTGRGAPHPVQGITPARYR